MSDNLQKKLRGDGTIPAIFVEADNLAEATYKSIIACHDYGARVETPKQREGMTLGYDANMTVYVKNPNAEPKIFSPSIIDDSRGVMQYILEVTHGIHNHWKKSKEHPDRWGYTYNERFVDQLPFVFQRIESDWKGKMNQWGEGVGRPSGRDYQFAIWRAEEDIIIEQEDPPCWQSGQVRLGLNETGEIVMSYMTHWRSRDLFKAWNENNIAQVELMKNFRDKISSVLSIPIKLGSYVDHCDSLHLYGAYIDKDQLEEQISMFKESDYEGLSFGLEDYLDIGGGRKVLKGLINAQSLAEKDGHGLNQPLDLLVNKEYDLENYPQDWDAWDLKWDAEPDKSKLARVK